MIDLCCHILPGFDGSAPFLEASVRMAGIAAESGCRILVTAPICPDGRDSMYRLCSGRQLSDTFHNLADQIRIRNIPLELRSGMLIHVTAPSKVVKGL
ncbi:MAG: hypothetical protein II627_07320, partial [Lachnospiraceae bacterium]|nr:hypothetical protein [Lachnospiraceae bacterium]